VRTSHVDAQLSMSIKNASGTARPGLAALSTPLSLLLLDPVDARRRVVQALRLHYHSPLEPAVDIQTARGTVRI
jgi:hypothetical protein